MRTRKPSGHSFSPSSPATFSEEKIMDGKNFDGQRGTGRGAGGKDFCSSARALGNAGSQVANCRNAARRIKVDKKLLGGRGEWDAVKRGGGNAGR